MSAAGLHVVSAFFNPAGFRRKTRLAREFLARQTQQGVTQWLIEAVREGEAPEVADTGNPRHHVVTYRSGLWLKENLINLAVARLPRDWRSMMWLDMDVMFVRPGWAADIVAALERYHAVQPFSHVVDLGPAMEAHFVYTGFAYLHASRGRFDSKEALTWHPGHAWAFTRAAWEATGGMIDRDLAGSADFLMAMGLIGEARLSLMEGDHPGYRAMVLDWQEKASRLPGERIGHLPGTLIHYFHGRKQNRFYVERRETLIRHRFDPAADIAVSPDGVIELVPGREELERDLGAYIRRRDEDEFL